MSELKQSLYSGVVVSSILGSTEGTYYKSDNGDVTDSRTMPVISTGDSGLSFGLTQLDIKHNADALGLFEQLVEDAYTNSRINLTQRDDYIDKAEHDGTWTLTDLSTIHTEVLQPGIEQIEQKD